MIDEVVRRELFDFCWDVHVDGYTLLKTKTVKNRPPLVRPTRPRGDAEQDVHELDKERSRPALFITSGLPLEAQGFKLRRFAPLAETGLFREFAGTAPTPEGVLAFANKYGLLGGRVAAEIELDRQAGRAAALGEPLSAWRDQIFFIREALRLWEDTRAGNVERLAKVIRKREVSGDEGVEYQAEEHPSNEVGFPCWYEKIATRNVYSDILEAFPPGDLIKPALYLVQRWVNRHLEGNVSPLMLWDKHRLRLQLYVVPHNLLGALWLQLARAIEGDKMYRQCGACMKWFELSPDTARTNRKFCSNACRSRDYRERTAASMPAASRGPSADPPARREKPTSRRQQGKAGASRSRTRKGATK